MKTFGDTQIGDNLYKVRFGEVRSCIITDITRKGNKTMMIKTDDCRYRMQVNINEEYHIFFSDDAIFTTKSSVLAYINNCTNNAKEKYDKEINRLNNLLTQLNEVK